MSPYLKTLVSKTRNDLTYISLAMLLLTGAWVLDRHFIAGTGNDVELWKSALAYLFPLIPLLTLQAKHAMKSKKRSDIVNRHWIMFFVGILMFSSSFLDYLHPQTNSHHLIDANLMLLIYGIGEIINTCFITAVRNPLRGKRSHAPVKVERNGKTENVNPQKLVVGDIIVIDKGETVPIDGTIIEGNSAFSTVTDRRVTHERKTGNKVYAGHINQGETVRIKVENAFGDSSTSVILDTTNRHDRPRAVEIAKTLDRYFVLTALPLAVVIGVVFPIMEQWFDLEFPKWVYRALMFSAIASSCSFAFSIPIAVAGGFSNLLRKDIVLNRYKLFDRLPKIRTLVFNIGLLDENTLTHNDVKAIKRAGVTRVVMMSDRNENETAAIAQQIGVKEYHSGMQPNDCSKLIKHLCHHSKQRKSLATIGNGSDDKDMLQPSSIRIVMTSPDNGLMIESADVAILDNNMSKIKDAILITKKTNRICWFNITLSVSAKMALLLLAVSGKAPISILATADILISLLTSLNSVRTLAK